MAFVGASAQDRECERGLADLAWAIPDLIHFHSEFAVNPWIRMAGGLSVSWPTSK